MKIGNKSLGVQSESGVDIDFILEFAYTPPPEEVVENGSFDFAVNGD